MERLLRKRMTKSQELARKVFWEYIEQNPMPKITPEGMKRDNRMMFDFSVWFNPLGEKMAQAMFDAGIERGSEEWIQGNHALMEKEITGYLGFQPARIVELPQEGEEERYKNRIMKGGALRFWHYMSKFFWKNRKFIWEYNLHKWVHKWGHIFLGKCIHAKKTTKRE